MTATDQDEGWSDRLKRQTRMTLEGGGVFVPINNQICLKHIGGAFGTIAVTDWLGGVLRIVDRDTGAEATHATIEELIEAGWAVD